MKAPKMPEQDGENTAPTPEHGSVYRHSGYGNARVVAVSRYYSTGQDLVTVEWFGRVPHDGTIPSPFSTYPADEFAVRFEKAQP